MYRSLPNYLQQHYLSSLNERLHIAASYALGRVHDGAAEAEVIRDVPTVAEDLDRTICTVGGDDDVIGLMSMESCRADAKRLPQSLQNGGGASVISSIVR